MVICLPHDLLNIYAFFCARYGNITYKELLDMGYEEFSAKLSSIPKEEPLYDIIKSRVIKLDSIKDKEERKYWRDLKQANKIPDIYKSNDMVVGELKNKINGNRGLLWNKKV